MGGWGKASQFTGIVGTEEIRFDFLEIIDNFKRFNLNYNLKRKNFAENVVSFCRKWGFDGIDLDWYTTLFVMNIY